MRLALPRLLLAAAVLSLGACATRPPADDPEALAEYRENNDPLEPANRVFYAVNDGLDTYVLRPLAVGYRTVVPGSVRRPIRNVISNISSPVLFANDVLQAKPRRAGDTLMRFLINTTAGVGGVFDVATGWGYPAHGTDFGLTLALWGLPDGPFLFLPVLGPSNPRDATGFAGNVVLDPFTWATFGGDTAFRLTRYGLGALGRREALIEPIDDIKRTALDPYATFRSLYRQNRASEVERTREADRATVPAWFTNR